MIKYDQSATFVDIPGDMVFEKIVEGEDPANAPPRMQQACKEWCASVLYGHYGIFECTHKKWPSFGMWFEFDHDAIHFKMRWFG